MNRIIVLLLLIFVLISCDQKLEKREVEASQLEKREEIFYLRNEEKVFTGTVLSYDENGNINRKYFIEEGKLEGENISYNENGDIEYKEFYKDNKLEGESISYDKNGEIIEKKFYKDGKMLK